MQLNGLDEMRHCVGSGRLHHLALCDPLMMGGESLNVEKKVKNFNLIKNPKIITQKSTKAKNLHTKI